jgi:hypothetical protein
MSEKYCIILTKEFTSTLLDTVNSKEKAEKIIENYIDNYCYSFNVNLEKEEENFSNDRKEIKVYSYIINWRGWLWKYPETNKKQEFTLTIDKIFNSSVHSLTFVDELKNKLNQPNFGLRQVRQYVFV